MVFLYNYPHIEVAQKSIKQSVDGKGNSIKKNLKELTVQNKIFLQSLGFTVL